MKFILAFIFIFTSFISFSILYRSQNSNEHLDSICKMVHKKIYMNTPESEKWYQSCLELKALSHDPEILKDQLNENFKTLGVSHLYVLNPEASKWAWQGVKKQKDKWVNIDESPKIVRRKDGATILKIPSFRGEYFTDKLWLNVVNQLKGEEVLYLDLRENLGGNFVAMLRVLSSFMCKPQQIGKLVNYNFGTGTAKLTNQLDERLQAEQFVDKKEVELHTFDGYDCLSPEIHVLVNKNTGSVSEILADVLQGILNAKVYGPGTRGGVVLGMNYDIEFWPKGYTLSIPEALYLNHQEQALEGVGLLMDQIEYPKNLF